MPSVAVFLEAFDPNNKRAKAFRAAVDSIREQTHKPDVIHVTGSGGYERKCAGWGGVEYHTYENTPLSAKRQAAMEFALASGADYLISWGSDDLMMPDYIERAVTAMESTGSDWGGVKHWWIAYKPDDFVVLEKYEYTERDDPMGAGRVYRADFIRERCPRLWRGKKSYSLDRENAELLKAAGAQSCVVDADIVLMKGPWESLTRLYHFRNKELVRQLPASQADGAPILEMYGGVLDRVLTGPPSDIRRGCSLPGLLKALNTRLQGRAAVEVRMNGRDAQLIVRLLRGHEKEKIRVFADVVSAQELPIQLMYILNVKCGERVDLDCAEWTAAAIGAK